MKRIGPVAYGALFCVGLPVLLLVTAWHLDARLGIAIEAWPLAGGTIAGLGLVLVVAAILVLMLRGKGLPMNAYPTRRRVEDGLYAWLAHPAYVGFTLIVLGLSLWGGSFAGLFILTPWTGSAALALVMGYEARATDRRLGARRQAPAIGLPENWPLPADLRRRLGATLAVFPAWTVVYCVFAALLPAADAFDTYLPFERDLPFWPGLVAAYSFTYVFALAVPFLVPDLASLRRFVLAGWSGTVIGGLVFALLPAVAPLRGVPPDNLIGWWLQLERGSDGITAALPSFHAFWIVVAAFFWRERFGAALIYPLALLQLAACHVTGMHSLADLLCGIVLALLCLNIEAAWHGLLRLAERVANDWRPLRLGSMRFFPHGLYILAAGALAFLATASLAPPHQLGPMASMLLAGLAGAVIFGQAVEASSKLSRPLGFFGGLIGASLAAGLLMVSVAIDGAMLAACAIGLCIAQMLGRLRCLAQGCCHGAALAVSAPPGAGLTYRHPLSRVGLIAGMLGRPIEPAPVFSMLANLLAALLLWRVLVVSGDAWLVAGLYCWQLGIARFAEEGLRGEPQTPVRGGLNLYQWLALAVTAVGFVIVLAAPFVQAATPHWPEQSALFLALPLACLWALAMSVDWPDSTKPLSRLTPGQ
ncbi:prolipoprotein diacylglyceryl transferase family protein [Labrys neptuniae]|uniref:Prolipoprotein diacylglyceryl transferase family protein n=1 Tax=Labrys neptuniae TaxID=376174 RepID=A0ABV3PW18_9HYPH